MPTALPVEIIRVNSRDYRLVWKPGIPGDNWGQHHPRLGEIWLSEEIRSQPSLVAEILWHECLHAMWFEHKLPLKNEEEIVAQLARAVTAFIRDNKTLHSFLTKQA